VDDEAEHSVMTPPPDPIHGVHPPADARRELHRSGGIVIEPDERVAVLLGPGERVLAARDDVALERSGAPDDGGIGGLYLTSDRLLFFGDRTIDVPLADIVEAEVLERQVLLRVQDASAVLIRVDDARTFRMEIGAARAAARVERSGQQPR
jgi:hypothetical protein